MGAVDLVLQVESPKSVARGLQRIGRAGHGVGDVIQGPDLPEVPRRPARVRGRRAADARGRRSSRRSCRATRSTSSPSRSSRSPPRPSDEPWRSTSSTRSSRARTPTPSSRAQLLENVLDMLDGRYPLAGVRRAAPAHRLGPRRRHDPRAQGRAPARDHQRRHDPRPRPVHGHAARRPPRRRARRGDGLRGAPGPDVPARRLDVADRGDRPRPRDRHARARRPRARCRSGSGDGVGRPKELGQRDRRVRALGGRPARRGARARLRPRRARRPQPARLPARAAGRDARRPERPHDRRRALPRRDRRLAPVRAVSPYGGRVHAAWGLALSARASASEFGLESDAIWSDDGIIVHLPDADEPPGRGPRARSSPTSSRSRSSPSSAASALFGARFRENAARALLIPRAYPGRRTPLWQQRLKSQSLLEVAKRYADFPIILETYRECLRDVLDLPGLHELLRGAAPPRAVARRGRDADRVAVRLLAALRLRRDLHVRGRHAQRRAPRGRPVARPRSAARAARPGGAARADRPRRARRRSRTTSSTAPSAPGPTTRDALADVLRRVGDLTADEAARPRARRAATPPRCSTALEARAARRARRASAARSAGSRPTTPACTATRSAPSPPGGLPDGLPGRRPRRARGARSPATRARTGRSPPPSCAPATASTRRARCAALERAGELVRGELRPGGTEREWCDPEVLRRLRRASLAVLRKEIEAADQRRARGASCPSWQGVDRHPAGGRRRRPPARGARPAAGAGAAGRRLGARRAAAPRRARTRRPGWTSSAPRARSSGSAPARSGATRAAWRCTSATTPRRSGRRRSSGEPPAEPEHEPHPRAPGRGAVLLHRPARRAAARARGDPGGAVGPRLGRRGDQRRLGAAARAAADARPRAAPTLDQRTARARRGAALRRAPPDRARRRRCRAAGRCVEPLLARAPGPAASAAAPSPSCCSSATGSSPASRCSPRASPGGFSTLYDALGHARDARRLPPRLLHRGPRRRAVRAARRGRAAARAAAPRTRRRRSCSPPPIPAQPYGAALPWPKRDPAPRPTRAAAQRVAGAYVVLAGAEPVALRRARRARACMTLVDADDPRLRPALEALADVRDRDARAQARARARRRRARRRLAVGGALVELGFRPGRAS